MLAVLRRLLVLLALAWSLAAAPALAAEVLQVRGPTLLQIGDSNRSYSVRLACVTLADTPVDDPDHGAMAWLRRELPRRTRVNLRPLGQEDGVLVARVERLIRPGETTPLDLGQGLVDAGLATVTSDCAGPSVPAPSRTDPSHPNPWA